MPSEVLDLREQTPLTIDTALADIYQRLYKARRLVVKTERDIASGSRWRRPAEEAALQVRLEEYKAAADLIVDETVPYDAEFRRRGGWTRAFLVTSSSNGHVHASTGCSTCQWTTEFIWLPEYSGSREDAIVNDAGERACTTCYPSAPVDVRSRATRIFSPDEKAAAVAREERAAAKVAREAERIAKSVSTPDGKPLRLESHGEVKTERTAQTLYVDRAATELARERGLRRWNDPYAGEAEVILAALAHKWGVGIEEARTKLSPKVEARIQRDYV